MSPDPWEFGWDALVAIGTLSLAAVTLALVIATVRLARQAKDEAANVGQQVELERQQLEAGQRPFVLPSVALPFGAINPEAEPERVVYLTNAGSGVAYNVRCALFWPNGIGGGAHFVPTAIPVGQTNVARRRGVWVNPNVDWSATRGYVRYVDLAGAEWQTHFTTTKDMDGTVWVDIIDFGTTRDLGEPRYSLEKGWENGPGRPGGA